LPSTDVARTAGAGDLRRADSQVVVTRLIHRAIALTKTAFPVSRVEQTRHGHRAIDANDP
jgi:hypothetical protein